MSRLMEELIRDVRHDKAVEVAINMLNLKKYPLEEISFVSQLPLEEVKSLADNQPA